MQFIESFLGLLSQKGCAINVFQYSATKTFKNWNFLFLLIPLRLHGLPNYERPSTCQLLLLTCSEFRPYSRGLLIWLIQLPQPTVKVIRAIVRQFEKAGTRALEAKELWETPEIKQADGLKALRQGGTPAELLRKTKDTLFAA